MIPVLVELGHADMARNFTNPVQVQHAKAAPEHREGDLDPQVRNQGGEENDANRGANQTAHHGALEHGPGQWLAARQDENGGAHHADGLHGEAEIPAERGGHIEQQHQHRKADSAPAHGGGARRIAADRHGQGHGPVILRRLPVAVHLNQKQPGGVKQPQPEKPDP